MIHFANPKWLWLLVGIVLAVVVKKRYRFFSAVRFSRGEALKVKQGKWAAFVFFVPAVLKVAALVVFVVALARPQVPVSESETSSKGVDIMLVQDVSPSMAAEDLKPHNRLFVAKKTLSTFISKRQTDRLGLVVFGADAYTQCPLTTDYGVLQGLLDQVEMGMAGDGTAIGMAIATALNRLKQSPGDSKIMILVTDGESNRGEIDPQSAAVMAKQLGVKIYTVGVGKEGGAPIPYMDPVRGKVYTNQLTRLDEGGLKAIATTTGGRYFRAVDSGSLASIYATIDKLEKTTISTKIYHDYVDYFPVLVWIGFGLVVLEFVLGRSLLRRVP